LPQFRLTEEIAAAFDQRSAELVEKLEYVRGFLRSRGRVMASFTGAARGRDEVARAISSWIAQMGAPPLEAEAGLRVPSGRPRDGLATQMDVAHCALAIPAPHLSSTDAPILAVAGRLLSLDYLLEEVRIKGGAYGAGCHHDALGGVWRFHSFNDPSIKKTLDTFSRTLDYVERAEWSQTDIDRAIIGTAKSAEEPIRPDYATGVALHRHVIGDAPEIREARHAAILRVTPNDLKRALTDALGRGMAAGGVCVVSSRERLEQANAEMPDSPLAIEDIVKT
jgi:Zn-dependent M16 (insulinase) family peptidase